MHNLRPFVNRVRYTPEVASKPDRMEKDLANAKILARLLEDQAAALRKVKVKIPKAETTDPAIEAIEGENGHVETQGDVTMADLMDDDDDEEPEERGSEAVERRVEKVMAEIQDRGLVDTNDEKALQAKRVRPSLFRFRILAYLRNSRRWYRSICTLHTCGLHSTHVTTVPL